MDISNNLPPSPVPPTDATASQNPGAHAPVPQANAGVPSPSAAPDSAPPSGSDAAVVTGPGTVTPAESQPTEENKAAMSVEAFNESFSDESLREIVDAVPKECLGKLYQAGDRLRHLVNERWQRGES